MAELKEGRILLNETELREKLLEGAKAAYDAVSTTYGPRGRNVIVERGFGRPTYTRDGVTVVEQVFFSDRSKNLGAQALAEASRTANNVSGDGSSATVVLGYHLLNNAAQAVSAGQHPMTVSETLVKDSRVVLDKLETLSVPVKDKQLKEVATVSAGDPLIGELIADAILYVGEDGGILTEKAPIPDIEREYIDGYYLQSGFIALQGGKKELVDPYVIISSKRLTSSADAIEILTGIMKANNLEAGQMPRILFIGNFEDAAYQTIVNTLNASQIDAIIIKTPPMYGELGKYLLEDLGVYANCSVITDSVNLKDFVKPHSKDPQTGRILYKSEFIGSVDKVVANKSESTLFADNATEAVKTRIEEIKDQIEAEEVPAIAEKLKDRVAKLEGKIAIFKIGGINDSIREETEFRVEDSINSTRHAYNEGIVAGGGITLLELSKLDISDITRNALRSTFQQLLLNAALPEQLKLEQALNAPKGQGFDLRSEEPELVDMIKTGIIDPVVVVREVLTNSFGAASNAIKAGMAVIFEDIKKSE